MLILQLNIRTNMNAYAYFCVFCVVLLANDGANFRNVAAFEGSYIITSVGNRKEMLCTTQNTPRYVSWFRTINDDSLKRRCPNRPFVLDGSSVFCDRLTNNRIVELDFRQRFSVPPYGTENENGLIITRVELSDAGIYACYGYNNSKILARINFTVEEVSGAQTTLKNQATTTDAAEHATTISTGVTTTRVTSSTEYGNTPNILIIAACLLVGFIAGLFVATAVLKNRPGIIHLAPHRTATTNRQVGMLPEGGASNHPATVDNYCELNTLNISPSSVYSELRPTGESASVPQHTPSSVYSELRPAGESASVPQHTPSSVYSELLFQGESSSMPSHRNTAPLEMPLYEDVNPSIVTTPYGDTSPAYENTPVLQK